MNAPVGSRFIAPRAPSNDRIMECFTSFAIPSRMEASRVVLCWLHHVCANGRERSDPGFARNKGANGRPPQGKGAATRHPTEKGRIKTPACINDTCGTRATCLSEKIMAGTQSSHYAIENVPSISQLYPPTLLSPNSPNCVPQFSKPALFVKPEPKGCASWQGEPRNNFRHAGLLQSGLDKANEDGERWRAGVRFQL